MARSIDESFYKTPAWRRCRAEYLKSHPLCEECLKAGMITPSKYVHHIIHLTRVNVRDPATAYGDENLQALCYDCHEKIHGRKRDRRYVVDELGRVGDPHPPD